MKICNCCNKEKDNKDFPKWKRNCNDCQHLKYCPKCKQVKLKEEFYLKVEGRCKKCHNKITEDNKKNNPSQAYLDRIKKKQDIRNFKAREKTKLNPKKIISEEELIFKKSIKRIRTTIHKIFKRWSVNKNKKSYDFFMFTKEEFLDKFPIIPTDMDIDHKIPLSWFRVSTPISILFNLDNLQLLERKENQRKCNYKFCEVSDSYLISALPFIKQEYFKYFQK